MPATWLVLLLLLFVYSAYSMRMLNKLKLNPNLLALQIPAVEFLPPKIEPVFAGKLHSDLLQFPINSFELLEEIAFSSTSKRGVGGQCVPMESGVNSGCASVIPPGTLIYLPTGFTQDQIDAQVSQQTGPFLLGLSDLPCTTSALEFICSQAFVPCDPVTSTPRFTCRDSCSAFSSDCGLFLSALDQSPPDCDTINPTLGIPNFPDGAYNFPISATDSIPQQCYEPNLVGPIGGVPRGTCISTSPASFPASMCGVVVDYSVFVPEGLSLTELDGLAAQQTGAVLLGLVGSLNHCSKSLMSFVCSAFFRPCTLHPVPPVQIVLPAPPCYLSCQDFNLFCRGEDIFVRAPSLLPNCSTVNVVGLPDYPNSSITFPLGSSEITLTCNSRSLQYIESVPIRTIPHGSCQTLPPQRFPVGPLPSDYDPLENISSSSTMNARRFQYSQCDSVVDWDKVFVPEGSSLGYQDFIALNDTFQLMYMQTPELCSAAALRLFCARDLLGCQEFDIGLPVNVVLPRPPDREVCQNFNRHCGSYLASLNVSLPDCTILPVDTFSVPISSELVLTTKTTKPANIVAIDRTCPPYTTITRDHPDQCSLFCPLRFYSYNQWQSLFIVDTTLAYLGIVCGFYTLFCFFTHPWKRGFPRSNAAWGQISVIMTNWSHILYSWGGGSYYLGPNAWCDGYGGDATLSNTGFCVVNFLLLYIGALTAAVWYFLTGFGLLTVVVNPAVTNWVNRYVLIGIFHFVAWVPVTVAGILIASTGQVDGGTGGCFCSNDQWDGSFGEVMFYIPLCLLGLGGCLLLFLVQLQIIRVIGPKGLLLHWRTGAYMLYGITVIFYICIYHWYNRGNEDNVADAIARWITCSATHLDYKRVCDTPGSVDGSPNYYYLISFNVVIMLLPTIFCLILASDSDIYLHWYDCFRRYILGKDVPNRWERDLRNESLASKMSGSYSMSNNM